MEVDRHQALVMQTILVSTIESLLILFYFFNFLWTTVSEALCLYQREIWDKRRQGKLLEIHLKKAYYSCRRQVTPLAQRSNNIAIPPGFSSSTPRLVCKLWELETRAKRWEWSLWDTVKCSVVSGETKGNDAELRGIWKDFSTAAFLLISVLQTTALSNRWKAALFNMFL